MRSRRRKAVISSSRLKAFGSFQDTFNSSLKNGWKSYRGSWVGSAGIAVSSSDPSAYAISAVKLSSSNFTISAGVSGGTGLTYWVSDANNWVASVSSNTTSTAYPCNAGFASGSNNPPVGNCCGGVTTIPGAAAYSYAATLSPAYSYTYGASYQGAYSYSYSAAYQGASSYSYSASYQSPQSYSYSASFQSGYSYTASGSSTARSYCCGTTNIPKNQFERINGIGKCSECSGPCSEAYSFSYCCPSGTELSGASCYYPATSSYSCPSGGSLSGTTCTVSGYYYCPSGGNVSGSTCNVTTSGYYYCPSGGSVSGNTCIVNQGAYYYCPSGGYVSGSNCIVDVGAYYYCPSGGSLSGSTCTVGVAASYYCPSGGSLSGSTCNVPGGANQYTCYTSTTTETTYNYYLNVIKSIGGVVSQVGSSVALPSQPLAIKVIASGTSVQSIAYSSVAMTTSIGTRTDNITSPARAATVGIIKAISSYNQGSTVSSFSATI